MNKFKDKNEIELRRKPVLNSLPAFNRFTGPSSAVVSGYSDHQIIQPSRSELVKSGK